MLDAGLTTTFERELDDDFDPVSLRPRAEGIDLVLTALTPLSHHDPAVQDDSNRQLFNRQKVLLPGRPAGLPDRETLERVCARFPVPATVAPWFADVTFPEFVGAALCRLFFEVYTSRNDGQGEGVFSGAGRYDRFEARARQAAVGAATLRQWWDRLTRALGVGVHPLELDADLLELLTVPPAAAQAALRSLADDARTLAALGRGWYTTLREQRRAGVVPELQALGFADAAEEEGEGEGADDGQLARAVDLPHVQANTLRSVVVRGPSWRHLCALLGLTTGDGELPPAGAAIFENGGNIAAGAKQPSDPFSLARKIRATFPSLDLLGGVTDSFDLGESRLSVAGWLVCRENGRALEGTPAEGLAQATVSAFEMLDDVTHTRRSAADGSGQMIVSFETLAAGAAVLCRLDLDPWTPELTRGALVAAVETFAASARLGGQAARGFARCRVERHDRLAGAEAARDAYERYLGLERERLVAALRDGTLGCGRVVVG